LGAVGDVGVGKVSAQDFGGLLLVRWIGVGVHEEDRDRLNAEALEVLGQCAERGDVERRHDLTGAPDALGDLEAELAWDQRLVAAVVEIEWIGAGAAGGLPHRPGAPCGEQRRPFTPSFGPRLYYPPGGVGGWGRL